MKKHDLSYNREDDNKNVMGLVIIPQNEKKTSHKIELDKVILNQLINNHVYHVVIIPTNIIKNAL